MRSSSPGCRASALILWEEQVRRKGGGPARGSSAPEFATFAFRMARPPRSRGHAGSEAHHHRSGGNDSPRGGLSEDPGGIITAGSVVVGLGSVMKGVPGDMSHGLRG